jgi:large subunit ribosomal protein L22
MAYEAVHRFAQISPRKVRPIADMIRGKLADEALDLLRYQPQRGARLLEKVLKSALANAEDRRAPNLNHLMVADVRVDQGPMFRRLRPQARGRAAIIKKRLSHIRIALE